ncbi:Rv3235 family protein [Streptomyces sp. NPDC093984]|uniref:Rv3235 family protein n=1 Tax=Streptomyces sp. NPDC093984 TaxID=3366052 RepID=UPI00380C62C7
MHKVMTRNQAMTRTKPAPGARPPVRHDTRRPGGAPRRAEPGQGPSRTRTLQRPSTTPAGATSAGATSAGAASAGATSAGAASASAASGSAASATAVSPPGQAAQGPLRPVPHVRPTDVFADRLLSVLSGQRPVHSMLRHTVGRAYDDLARLAERGPLRTRGTRPVVRDIGYYVPRPGAIEAFARIGAGDQLRAMAFRLECGRDHRWRCTAVELGGPRTPHGDGV